MFTSLWKTTTFSKSKIREYNVPNKSSEELEQCYYIRITSVILWKITSIPKSDIQEYVINESSEK